MNFTKFCRACSTEIEEGYKGIYLFDGNSKILEMFTKCTALEVSKLYVIFDLRPTLSNIGLIFLIKIIP